MESKNGNGNGNGLIKKYQILKRGVCSPLLIELLLQYLKSSTIMLQVNEKAVINSLLSINLMQLLSVITQWEFISVYKIKTVYSALNLFLQKIRDCITNLRNKSLISSFYGNSIFLNVDNKNELSTNTNNINDNIQENDQVINNDIKLVETDNSDNHADFISNKEENIDNLILIDDEVMKKNKIQNRVETAIVDRIIEIKNNDEDGHENDNENEIHNENENESDSQKESLLDCEEDNAIELLMQLSCVITSYIGLLACSLLQRQSHRQ